MKLDDDGEFVKVPLLAKSQAGDGLPHFADSNELSLDKGKVLVDFKQIVSQIGGSDEENMWEMTVSLFLNLRTMILCLS